MSPFAVLAAGAWGLTLLGVGAGWLLWRRRVEKAFRPRLARAAAPLAGPALAETGGSVSEESVFRPRERRSWLSGLWDAVESRYPLLDAPPAVAKALGFGLLAGAGGWFSLWFLKLLSGWWLLPAAVVIAGWGVWYALSWLQGKQVTEFIRQFPETVDQITRLASAGVPALEALGVTAEDTPAPVGPVLRDVRDGLAAGLDADAALRVAAERVRISEFTMFAAVIRLQRRSGGRISAAFSNLAETLRERAKTALRARTASAQTRLTLLVLAVMPVAVLVAQKFMAPDALDTLFGTEEGRGLLRWGVGLIVAGLLIARSMAARVER